MRKFIILLFLLPTVLYAQQVEPNATIKLSDGTVINNAPSGRSWNFDHAGIIPYTTLSDTLVFDDSGTNFMTYNGNWTISTSGNTIPEPGGNCNCSFSKNAGDNVIFKFTDATDFYWAGEKMPHHGIAEVFVNGQPSDLIDTYSPSPIAPNINYALHGLDTNSIYEFKVQVTGDKNTSSTGAFIVNHWFALAKNIVVPIPEPTDSTIIKIENIDSNILYTGTWSVKDNRTESSTDGSYFEYTFTKAKSIKWIGSNNPYQGIANIYINEALDAQIDCYNTTTDYSTLLYVNTQLDPAKIYTVKIEVSGTKNPASNNDWIGLDYLEIETAEPEPPVPPVDSIITVIDTVRVLDNNISITRQGRFQIFVDGVQDEGEHNEYEKAIEHGIRAKLLNPTKNVTIISPTRVILLEN